MIVGDASHARMPPSLSSHVPLPVRRRPHPAAKDGNLQLVSTSDDRSVIIWRRSSSSDDSAPRWVPAQTISGAVMRERCGARCAMLRCATRQQTDSPSTPPLRHAPAPRTSALHPKGRTTARCTRCTGAGARPPRSRRDRATTPSVSSRGRDRARPRARARARAPRQRARPRPSARFACRR